MSKIGKHMNKNFIALFLILSSQQTVFAGLTSKIVKTTGFTTLAYATSIAIRSDFNPNLNTASRIVRADKDATLAFTITQLRTLEYPQAHQAADYLQQFKSSTLDIVQDQAGKIIDEITKDLPKK